MPFDEKIKMENLIILPFIFLLAIKHEQEVNLNLKTTLNINTQMNNSSGYEN